MPAKVPTPLSTSSAKESVEDAEKSSSNAAFGVPKNEQNQVFNAMPKKPVSLIASPDRDENEGIHDSKPKVAISPPRLTRLRPTKPTMLRPMKLTPRPMKPMRPLCPMKSRMLKRLLRQRRLMRLRPIG